MASREAGNGPLAARRTRRAPAPARDAPARAPTRTPARGARTRPRARGAAARRPGRWGMVRQGQPRPAAGARARVRGRAPSVPSSPIAPIGRRIPIRSRPTPARRGRGRPAATGRQAIGTRRGRAPVGRRGPCGPALCAARLLACGRVDDDGRRWHVVGRDQRQGVPACPGKIGGDWHSGGGTTCKRGR